MAVFPQSPALAALARRPTGYPTPGAPATATLPPARLTGLPFGAPAGGPAPGFSPLGAGGPTGNLTARQQGTDDARTRALQAEADDRQRRLGLEGDRRDAMLRSQDEFDTGRNRGIAENRDDMLAARDRQALGVSREREDLLRRDERDNLLTDERRQRTYQDSLRIGSEQRDDRIRREAQQRSDNARRAALGAITRLGQPGLGGGPDGGGGPSAGGPPGAGYDGEFAREKELVAQNTSGALAALAGMNADRGIEGNLATATQAGVVGSGARDLVNTIRGQGTERRNREYAVEDRNFQAAAAARQAQMAALLNLYGHQF